MVALDRSGSRLTKQLELGQVRKDEVNPQTKIHYSFFRGFPNFSAPGLSTKQHFSYLSILLRQLPTYLPT